VPAQVRFVGATGRSGQTGATPRAPPSPTSDRAIPTARAASPDRAEPAAGSDPRSRSPRFPRGKQGHPRPERQTGPLARQSAAPLGWSLPVSGISQAPKSRGRARRPRTPGLRRRTPDRPGAAIARGETRARPPRAQEEGVATEVASDCPRTRVIAAFDVGAATISIRPLHRAHSRTSRRNTRQIRAAHGSRFGTFGAFGRVASSAPARCWARPVPSTERSPLWPRTQARRHRSSA